MRTCDNDRTEFAALRRSKLSRSALNLTMPSRSVLMESEVEQLSQTSNALPLPGTEAYEALPQLPKRSPLPFRRPLRRQELRLIVPLAETTIYEMERRGEFPRRFNLTPRCVVWDLAEVEAWAVERKQRPRGGISKPNVLERKTRPVRAGSNEA